MSSSVTRDQLLQAVEKLNSPTQRRAFEAAVFLYRHADERVERPLIKMLQRGRRPFNRAAAAFVMQMVRTGRTVSTLEQTVSNIEESVRVRGEAAEALAHNHRRKSHTVLLGNLEDRSKDVRFWCAFALGEMAEQRAIPTLTRVAKTDHRVVRGFHSVSQEATDALKNIEVENVGHRTKNRCIFCVSP